MCFCLTSTFDGSLESLDLGGSFGVYLKYFFVSFQYIKIAFTISMSTDPKKILTSFYRRELITFFE